MAGERATLLLGCYRRSDAADPDVYARAIACVLEAYDDWIIREATHPRTGIQATEKFKAWPPNVGELKEFCDVMAESAKYAVHDHLPKPNLLPRIPPPIDSTPGRRANLLVTERSASYGYMLQRAQHPDSDPVDWIMVPGGIKVPLHWWHDWKGSI